MTSTTKPLNQVIAERVRTLRTDRGWNQRELARRLGEVLQGPPSWEDHTTVNLIEKGKRRVLAAELLALAHVFEVDAATLVLDPGSPAEVDLGRGPVPLRMGADAAAAALTSDQRAGLIAAGRVVMGTADTLAAVNSTGRRIARMADSLAQEMKQVLLWVESVATTPERQAEIDRDTQDVIDALEGRKVPWRDLAGNVVEVEDEDEDEDDA